MNKITQRLLTFFIGIPVVLGLIYLDYGNHLAFNIAVILFSAMAAIELHGLFSENTKMPPLWFCVILSIILPVLCYVCINVCPENTERYDHWGFIALCLIILIYEVFGHKTFEESNKRLSSTVFLVFYCGFLISFVTRMSLFHDATIFIAVFLLTIFMNDSLAWLFGMLFGKNNRGYVAASPNKSIAGFIGGYIGAIGICIIATFLWPELLDKQNFWKAIILGFITATAGIIGDLTESVFKRSAGKKDSGKIIPGRGGILDSCDSILFAAPVFYIVLTVLYNPATIFIAQ